jgi:hypothetical protein
VPSSLLFTGLVVVWLLILVPTVARHQQEVARPGGASLAGRVLPRRRGGPPTEEGDSVDEDGTGTVGSRGSTAWASAAVRRAEATVTVPAQRWSDDRREPDDELEPDGPDSDSGPADDDRDDREDDGTETDGERRWERPPPRYRPGRGGFDPDADAESARRRYAFRQRMVLTLLVLALLTAVAAAAAMRVLWWAHAGVDLLLVGYLIYLRKQVREEAAIRERRTARMAGTRRTSAADDHELDEWARRGREATRRPLPSEQPDGPAPEREAALVEQEGDDPEDDLVDELGDELVEDGDTARVRGIGEPVGLLPARRRGTDTESAEPGGALPPLTPAPPPALPPGTSLVDVDDDDLDLHDLGETASAGHRRAGAE